MFAVGLDAQQLKLRYKRYAKVKADTTPLQPPSSPSIRIATYNVHMETAYLTSTSGGEEGIKAMVAAITAMAPDIICFQEVRPAPSRLCAGLEYSHFQRMFSGFGNGMCSRFPLRDLFSRPYRAMFAEERGLLGATVDVPFSPLLQIRVYTTHLDVYDDSERTRLAQVHEMHALIEADLARLEFTGPVLLMGDFNALHRGNTTTTTDAAALLAKQWEWIVAHDLKRRVTARTMAMDYLLSPSTSSSSTEEDDSKWIDVFAPNTPLVTAWSLRRIDYILLKRTHVLPPNWTMQPRVVYTAASDHFPLLVDLVYQEA